MPFRIGDLFSDYLRHQDINDYLDYLQLTYPQLVTVSTVGYSYEQRPIKVIRIACNRWPKIAAAPKSFTVLAKTNDTCCRSAVPRRTPMTAMATTTGTGLRTALNANGNAAISVRCNRVQSNGVCQQQQLKGQHRNQQGQHRALTAQTVAATVAAKKSIVLIDGGLHAREWATISTALYCINQLVEHFDNNRKLLLQHDFVIVPIVNVDGYEYSHTNVSGVLLEEMMWEYSWRTQLHFSFISGTYKYRIACGGRRDGQMESVHTTLERIVIAILISIGGRRVIGHQNTHIEGMNHFLSRKPKFYVI